MTDNNGITISDITANAAIWAPDEQAVISFKFKNGAGKKILNMRMDIILMVKDFTGGTSTDTITLAQLVGDGYYMSAVNIANGKSKTYSTSFTIPTVAEQYFSENQNVRAVPIYIRYTATDSDGAYGSAFQIDALKVLNHRFNPQITAMQLTRAKDGVPDDEGENVLTTLKLGVDAGDLNYSNFLTARLYRAQGDNATTADPAIDLTGKVAQLLGGVTDDKDLIPDTYSKAYDWDFLLVFGDEYESFHGRFNLGMAFANLHLSEEPTGGACFGGFSTSRYGKPKLESYFPGYFYNGIAKMGDDWNYLTPLNGTTPADLGGGALRCRKIENKRIIEGSIKVKGKVDSNGDDVTVVLAELPNDYTPEKAVFSINACKGGRVARIVVGGKGETNAGYLCLSWIKNLSNGSSYTSESIWVQCSIEYWVEATEEDVPSTANMIDSNGAVVIDDDGKAFGVRETGDQIYQSRYTGLQIDDGIQAAYNAASKTYVDNAISEIELTPGPAGPDGPAGKDGSPGKDGYTPVKGVDYFDGQPGAAGKDGVDGKNGKDGKSAYEYAMDGLYEGTEEDFANDLGKIGTFEYPAWANVTGKPFGDPITGSSVANGSTLAWDGDEKHTPILVTVLPRSFFYVSENVPSGLDLKNATIECTALSRNDSEYISYNVGLADTQSGDTFSNCATIYNAELGISNPLVLIVRKKGIYAAAGTSAYFERPGVYFMRTSSLHISSLTISGYTFTQSTILTGIDPTLTVHSMPADAKAVGDMLIPVRTAFETHEELRKIEWDGYDNGRVVVQDAISGARFVHVSDYAPEADLMIGGYTLTVSGQDYKYSGYTYKGEDYYNLGLQGVWVIAKDRTTVTIGGASTGFQKKGTYFATASDGTPFVTALTSAGMQAEADKLTLKEDHIPALTELIMIGADGNRYKLTINENGQLTTTAI